MTIIKIAIDAGHGLGTAGKQTPNGEKEWSFNNKVALAAIAKLNTYQNVQILRLDDPTGKTDISLETRVKKANDWNADVLVSIHHNALKGVWGTHGGVETFAAIDASKASVDLANIINPLIVNAMGLKNRGVKRENWYIIRYSKMPAILTEGGFMDSTIDIIPMRNDAKLKAQGEAIVEGLVKYFKLVPKANNNPAPAPSPTEMYRVRKTWSDTKSQIGAYTVLQNAKDLADKNKGYSVFNNAGNNIYTPKIDAPKVEPEPKPEPPKQEISNPIMGKSQATVGQMIAFVENNNPNAKNLREIALSFLEVGEKYGIRGDVAYCQSIIETGWFRFDGGTAVTYDQHNYCGLGVVSKGVKGHSFATVKEGVTAQIQHLYAYASKDNLPSGEVLVDPRYNYVTRGIAPSWESLSNRWAMNPNYGSQILSMYDNLLKVKVEEAVNENENNVNDLIEAFSWALKDKEAQKLIYDLWKKGGK